MFLLRKCLLHPLAGVYSLTGVKSTGVHVLLWEDHRVLLTPRTVIPRKFGAEFPSTSPVKRTVYRPCFLADLFFFFFTKKDKYHMISLIYGI